MELQDELKQVLEKIAIRQGLFLVESSFFKHSGIYQIKAVVDKNGGVLLDDCVKLSKALSKYIEEAQILAYNFNIEVSSPGLDRKFVSIDDFVRCIGKRIKISSNRSVDGECEFCGKIISAANEQIKILLDTDKELTINFNDIKKAKLEIRWEK